MSLNNISVSTVSTLISVLSEVALCDTVNVPFPSTRTAASLIPKQESDQSAEAYPSATLNGVDAGLLVGLLLAVALGNGVETGLGVDDAVGDGDTSQSSSSSLPYPAIK